MRKCVYARGGISSSEAPTVTVEFFFKAVIFAREDDYSDAKSTHTHDVLLV